MGGTFPFIPSNFYSIHETLLIKYSNKVIIKAFQDKTKQTLKQDKVHSMKFQPQEISTFGFQFSSRNSSNYNISYQISQFQKLIKKKLKLISDGLFKKYSK